MAWFEARGSPSSATWFLYSGLSRSAQSFGGFGDGLGVGHERHDAVVVAVPGAVSRLGGLGDGVPGRDLVRLEEVLVGLAEGDSRRRRRRGSGGRGCPTLALMASISSPELASGSSTVDVDAVLGLEGLDDLAVVAPVVRQGDGGQRPFGLGRGDQVGHRVGAGAPATRRPRTAMPPRSVPPPTGPSTRPACRRRPAGRRRRSGRAPGSGHVAWWFRTPSWSFTSLCGSRRGIAASEGDITVPCSRGPPTPPDCPLMVATARSVEPAAACPSAGRSWQSPDPPSRIVRATDASARRRRTPAGRRERPPSCADVWNDGRPATPT